MTQFHKGIKPCSLVSFCCIATRDEAGKEASLGMALSTKYSLLEGDGYCAVQLCAK